MIRLPRSLYDEVMAHCRSQYPKEACGILAGGEGVVGHVYPMRNVEDSPVGYSMDPREQLAVEKQMRSKGQRMIGVVHSHTATDAYPSPVDVRLAISPDVSYVLVSLKNLDAPVIKSYRINGTLITEEPVAVEETQGLANGPTGKTGSTEFVDVRDMTCAQALAVVARAASRLASGQPLNILYNAQDVKRDLIVWATDRGVKVSEGGPDRLQVVG